MKIVLIGAGNVATHLGTALKEAGYELIQVYSRTEQSASTLAHSLDIPYTTSVNEISTHADMYLVAIKDAVLLNFIPLLTKGRTQSLFVHTAGSMPMDVWKPYVSRYGVLYPMQTFSKQHAVDFTTVPFFVEASNPDDLNQLKLMGTRLGSNFYEASSEQRKYLHLAAVFACNFSNHMYALCAQLLEQQHIPFEVMLPLIDETARKVHELAPHQAQTGPAVRQDENVLQKHMELLLSMPDMQALYKEISKSIYNLKKEKE